MREKQIALSQVSAEKHFGGPLCQTNQGKMFASVRSAFDIPRDQSLRLRDFPTLAHVIQFARNGHNAMAPSPVAAEPAAPQPSTPEPANFDAAEAVPRRVPVPQLRPPLDCCKPTGVSLTARSRVAIMRPGTSARMALMMSRASRVRFSKEPP